MSDQPQAAIAEQWSGPPLQLPLTQDLSLVFARMSGLLLCEETVATSLRLIAELADDAIEPSIGCGVTLIDGRGRRGETAGSQRAVEAPDALQDELRCGPYLTAWGHRSIVHVDDTGRDDRWPRWCAAVQPLGVSSVLSAPMIAGGRALGAITAYSREPLAFGTEAERRLGMFAWQAAVLLANMQSHEAATNLSEGLKQALASRDVIATAKGILMARDGITDEAAFGLLVRASQRQQAKLRDVAETIVAAVGRRAVS